MACHSCTGADVFTASSPGIPSFGDLTWHKPVVVATLAALPANTYASGPPATMTANANGAIPQIDTQTVQVGWRVLIRNEATAAHDGIYVVTALGDASHPWVLTRASDADTAAEVAQGSVVLVTNGLVNSSRSFLQSAVIANIDTSPETWRPTGVKFSLVYRYYGASATWTFPTDPSFLGLLVQVIGGGGGGGGCAATAAGGHAQGGGGGSGGWSRAFVGFGQLGATEAVTVGGGGAGGVGAGAAGAGSASSFGTHVVANGGAGGVSGAAATTAFTASAGGIGGNLTGVAGDDFVNGNPGSPGIGQAITAVGGLGGAAHDGGAGQGAVLNNGTGVTNGGAGAQNSGSGGGGAGSTNGSGAASGGAGAAGYISLYEYYSS